MKQNKQLRETLGWVGVAFVVSAYFAVSVDILGSDSVVFQGLNLFGAIFLIGSSLNKRDWQPVALNTVWAGIAIVGLLRAGM